MKKKSVIYGCLLFVFIYSMCSCGARKVNIEKQKEVSHTEISDNSLKERKTDTNVKTTTTVKVDDKTQTVTEETILEPADNTKESFVIEKDGTKTVLNNTKKTVRKTTKNNNTQVVSNLESAENKNEVFKEQKAVERKESSKKEIKRKETDRKAIPWYYYAIGIVVIGIIYYGLKKFRII